MFDKDDWKKYRNYRKATVLDIESDGLLDTVTKIYIVGFKMSSQSEVKVLWGDTEEHRIKAMFQWHIDNEIPVACHNATTYDVPLVEKIYGMDLSDLIVIDTLGLSWYLNINNEKHSLEFLGESYDVAKKYQVDNDVWVNLTKEQAVNRVTSDVEINVAVYEDFIDRLENMYSLSKEQLDLGVVGGKRMSVDEEIYIDRLIGLPVEDHVARLLEYLAFKKQCQAIAEKTKWQVDIPYLEEAIEKLEVLVKESADKLEAVMPPVPVYGHRKEPKDKFKKNGEKSVGGLKWEALLEALKREEKDDWGNLKVQVMKEGYISEITSYSPPNINSHIQVKDFLYSHDWKPLSFKYVKDEEAMKEWSKNKPKKGASHWEWNDWKNNKPEERAIPQVRIDGKEGKELCESVSELAEQVPEISYLEEYSVIKHRLDTLKGILTRVDDCGKVEASFGGLTNSLRCKHRSPIVNLPAANRKYAEPIRGSLVAPKSSTLLGSDLKSVEDRIKHSMMLPYDADYVNKMLSDNYDPHLETAIAAGLITEEDAQAYKDGSLAGEDLVRVTLARHKGKTINYSSVYGIGADKLARSLGVSVEEAKIGLEGYWELNSSVKSIAADQVVVKDRLSREWLINPINGLLYSVRGEKDYFSTLIQGSGSYLFDMWLKGILKRQWDLWGKVTLTAQVHDEFVLCFKDLAYFREVFSEMINSSLGDVNKEYMLRRELGCSIAFGSKYSEIH